MPLKGEYTWVDKGDNVRLFVPLKGVSKTKVDIAIASGSNLKINYSPYLIDIFLYAEVDSHSHKASVSNGVLAVTLYKRQQQPWPQLELVIADKQDFKEKKLQAMESQMLLQEQTESAQKEKRIEEERTSTRQQMAIESAERERLESLKAEEKAAAERDVYETLTKLQQGTRSTAPAKSSTISASASASAKPSNKKVSFETDAVESDDWMYEIDEEVDEDNDSADADADPSLINAEPEEPEVRYIPPPRQIFQRTADGSAEAVESSEAVDVEVANPKVRINFTPRLFPTPMRESKAAEEEDWIAKNRRHLKNHGVLSKGLKTNGKDISEEDPVWLKAKADDFFRSGDVRSAINAYSAAIDADDQFVACISNRALCYLQLQLFAQCQLDCDTAIGILQKQISECTTGNASEEATEKAKLIASQVKLLLRRGTAFCSLGQFEQSYSDYCSALVKFQTLPMSVISLTLKNISAESIKTDVDRLKLLCSIEVLKKEGDSLIAEKQLSQALAKYDEVLTILPLHVSALSNRATCRLALGDVDGALTDCSTAIQLLQMDSQSSIIGRDDAAAGSMLSAILPPPQSEKRKQWLLRTLVRKAVALVQLERFSEAIEQYQIALQMDSSNESIRSDLANLKSHVESLSAKASE